MSALEKLLSIHSGIITGENPYAYFELAYTRQTEWMAWLCSEPKESNPNRVVFARGQGDTPEAACESALVFIKSHNVK